MEIKKITSLGMQLDLCIHKSCEAQVGVGDDFATVYHIESKEQGGGHATELMVQMREHYEGQGKKFASSVALSEGMKHILKKLNIYEHGE